MRSLGMLGIGVLVVMLIGETASPMASSSRLDRVHRVPPLLGPAPSRAVDGPMPAGSVSAAARSRAIADRQWDEVMRERCAASSPFAAPAPREPVC